MQTPKKITFVISSISNFGGSERITCGFANELAKRNYSVTIITLFNSIKPFFNLDQRIAVQSIFKSPKKPSKFYIPAIPLLFLFLFRKKENRPDILIGVFMDMIVYSGLAKILYKIKFVSWEHFNYNGGDPKALFPRITKKLTIYLSDYLVVLTPNDEILFKQNWPLKCPVLALPNFMSFKVSQPSSLHNKTAIAMGRFSPEKGFDSLIKIWQKVAPVHNDWKLKIIGDGVDKSMLMQMVADYNLQSSITFYPPSNNVADYYTEASLFLLTSRWEGFGMVLIEAKSFGLPIVSFDCPNGPRLIIKHGEDGLLIPDQDINAFATTLNNLLTNAERLNLLGAQALYNSKDFSAQAIVPKWEQLFIDLSNK